MDDLILWDYLDYPALDEVKLNQEKRHYAKKHDFLVKLMKVIVIRSLNSPKNRSQYWKRENSLSDFQKNNKRKIQQSSWPQSDRRRSTLVKEIQGIRDSA